MEEWHSQVFRHAFVELPQILLTQVGRFKPDSRGRLRRRTMQIKPVFDAIMVPRFVDEGLHTCFVPYKPMAVICHEGKDPQPGHYICMLCDADCGWICDDNVPPTRYERDAIPEFVSRNAYVILYSREH